MLVDTREDLFKNQEFLRELFKCRSVEIISEEHPQEVSHTLCVGLKAFLDCITTHQPEVIYEGAYLFNFYDYQKRVKDSYWAKLQSLQPKNQEKFVEDFGEIVGGIQDYFEHHDQTVQIRYSFTHEGVVHQTAIESRWHLRMKNGERRLDDAYDQMIKAQES